MGGKQSTVGEVSVIQTPVTESIQDAYKAGDTSKAQELIKLSCEETALQVEKVGLGYYSFSDFIGKETKMPSCCLVLFLMQKIHLVMYVMLVLQGPRHGWLCGALQEHLLRDSICP